MKAYTSTLGITTDSHTDSFVRIMLLSPGSGLVFVTNNIFIFNLQHIDIVVYREVAPKLLRYVLRDQRKTKLTLVVIKLLIRKKIYS